KALVGSGFEAMLEGEAVREYFSNTIIAGGGLLLWGSDTESAKLVSIKVDGTLEVITTTLEFPNNYFRAAASSPATADNRNLYSAEYFGGDNQTGLYIGADKSSTPVLLTPSDSTVLDDNNSQYFECNKDMSRALVFSQVYYGAKV